MFQGATDELSSATGSSNLVTGSERHRFRAFYVATALLLLAFAKPLFVLVRYSLSVDLYSHVLLIPLIAGYFLWQAPPKFRSSSPSLKNPAALALSGAGILVLSAYFFRTGTPPLPTNDYLAFTIFPLICFFTALVLFFFGTSFAKSIAFPLGFLIFLVPFPTPVENGLERISVLASAEVYSWMMSISQATYYREGVVFVLPNLTLQVAQECSGIRSSFVLFLVSLIAGQMFLKSTASRLFLAAVVFPLGIVRNAFRIYVLSMASAHWNANVIHSPLHHKGGPIFFALSLVPFFVILFWLKKRERSTPK